MNKFISLVGDIKPTLSILVPVYNWNITQLLETIGREIVKESFTLEVEVVLVDDFSTDLDSPVNNLVAVDYWQRKGVHVNYAQNLKNVGRSSTRNKLVAASKGLFLLFLDADVLPDDTSFIKNYLRVCQSGTNAACGGVSYKQCGVAADEVSFYMKYSGSASVAFASVRNLRPWAWVFTANMMVSREVFMNTPFDESFDGYGYEDIEWGVRLSECCGIVHFDNTVTHLGLLTKDILYKKLLASGPNLIRFYKLHPAVASKLAVIRISLIFTMLPLSVLNRLSFLCGWIFINTKNLYPLEFVMLQSTKIFLAASLLKKSI